jgi:predicted acetyltransferase
MDMNSEIRKLTNEEIRTYVDIVINAYPGIMQNTPDFKDRFYTNLVDLQEHEESIDFFGLFRDGKLIGGMRIHYFKMNLYSKRIDVGGIGLVAVDLLHKKEKVAKELIQYFITYFQTLGTSLVMLYPFRPDFYKKMGFGYGPKMNQYQVEPIHFPNEVSKEGITFLNETHKEQIRDCYNRYSAKTHGMIDKTDHELNSIFKNPNNKLVGYMNKGELEGYLRFSFKKVSDDNFLTNNLVIHELIYENPLALAKLNTFIHTQADQIQRVIVHSVDEFLPFMFSDARNGSNQMIPSVYHETNTSGVGLMYRIIDIEKFLLQLKNFEQLNLDFKLKVYDSFLTSDPITKIVNLQEGQVTISDNQEYDFEIEIDISNLSSLLMGVIDVNRLYQYGLLKIDNIKYLDIVDKLLRNNKQPVCVTAF